MIFAVVVAKTVDHEHVPNSLLAQIMSVSFSLCPRKMESILQQKQYYFGELTEILQTLLNYIWSVIYKRRATSLRIIVTP